MEPEQAETLAKAGRAVEPDDARKPARITQLAPSSWWYALRRSVHNFIVDIDQDVAGTLTYFAVLSIFPALLALLTLLSLVGEGQATADWIMKFLSTHAAPTVVEFLRDPIEHLTHAPSAGWVLAASLALALWGAAGYVGAFGRAMNRVYDVAEGRPIWIMIPYNLLLTAITLVFGAIAMLTILLSGSIIRLVGGYVGAADAFANTWDLVRWPLLVVIAVIYTAALYYATPNVRQSFRWVTPGSVVALLFMALAVLGFNFYVANFGTWNTTYGAVGSVIVLLLGLWLANCALLFGGEVDAELERVRELQGGIEAERTIQLPPRDIRIIREVIRNEEKFVDEGRRLRERFAGAVPEVPEALDASVPEADVPEDGGPSATGPQGSGVQR